MAIDLNCVHAAARRIHDKNATQAAIDSVNSAAAATSASRAD
jgi:hypothetical protein